jgi:hypothetical protein
MTPKIDTEKFLSLWERIWGELGPEWNTKFLNDPRIEKILAFSETSIQLAIFNNKKLDDIISYLEKHGDNFEKSFRQTNVVEKKQQKQKTDGNLRTNPKEDAEFREIYDWLTEFSLAKLDPENTFPRLIIKSDRETCQNKVSYSNEKEAIFALIELGNRKKEIIKQLPYKCNICRNFHNTHLISRETIQKLLNKYKQLKRRN